MTCNGVTLDPADNTIILRLNSGNKAVVTAKKEGKPDKTTTFDLSGIFKLSE